MVSGAGSLEIGSRASLELAQGNAENLAFEPDSAGVLVLVQPGSYSGTMTGFGDGVQDGVTRDRRIDLPYVAPGSAERHVY